MKAVSDRRFGFGALLLPLMVANCSGQEGEPKVEVPPSAGGSSDGRNVRVWGPGEGDHLWVFPKTRDELGPGGEFHIYLDYETDPSAKASFAKFSLGVGGALAEHRHEKTEELAYLLSGRGVVVVPAGRWWVMPATTKTLLLRRVLWTPSMAPNFARTHWTNHSLERVRSRMPWMNTSARAMHE
jgi:mannose-6-phosphate isomerase-like protein (cupin superfamily)